MGKLLALVYTKRTRKLETNTIWSNGQVSTRVSIAVAEKNGNDYANRETLGQGTIKMDKAVYDKITKDRQLMQRYESFLEKVFRKW